MDDIQFKEIINSPEKMFNLLRLFHQMLHIYDEQEMKKALAKDGTIETAGLGDKLSVVAKDSDGNIKAER
jgi:hypothetical protein